MIQNASGHSHRIGKTVGFVLVYAEKSVGCNDFLHGFEVIGRSTHEYPHEDVTAYKKPGYTGMVAS